MPLNEQRADQWKKMNSLKPSKVMVWIDEVPWHEIGINKQLETENEFCRQLEFDLRKKLYTWDNFQVDNIMENVLYCPVVINDTGFGLEMDDQVRRTSGQGQEDGTGFGMQDPVEGRWHYDVVVYC